MSLVTRLRDWFRAQSLVVKIASLSGIAASLLAVVALIAVPVTPNGYNVLGFPAVGSPPSTAEGVAPSQSPNPTRGPNGGSNSGATGNDTSGGSGNAQPGREVCDEGNRSVDPTTKARCVKGYVAPILEVDKLTCQGTDTVGTFTVVLDWKLVGGSYKDFRMASGDRSGALQETWTMTDVTPETPIVDGRQVVVRFLSMSEDPGRIDAVKSSPAPRIVASDVCTFPTPEPTEGGTGSGTDG